MVWSVVWSAHAGPASDSAATTPRATTVESLLIMRFPSLAGCWRRTRVAAVTARTQTLRVALSLVPALALRRGRRRLMLGDRLPAGQARHRQDTGRTPAAWNSPRRDRTGRMVANRTPFSRRTRAAGHRSLPAGGAAAIAPAAPRPESGEPGRAGRAERADCPRPGGRPGAPAAPGYHAAAGRRPGAGRRPARGAAGGRRP